MKHALLLAVLLAPAAAGAGTLAIENARVHTLGAQGTLDKATLLIRDGRIAALGADVSVPAGARRVDAAGRPVTPGLFDAASHIGLIEISLSVDGTRDTAVSQRRFSAALDLAEALNPLSTLVAVNRIEGLTRAMAAPTAVAGGSLILGQGALIGLGDGDLLMQPRAAMFADFGEAGAATAGGSRPAALLWLREAFEEARTGGRPAVPNRDAQLGPLDIAALRRVLGGQLPLVVDVHSASDIRALLRLADDYKIRLILRGAEQAWMLADELARRDVPVILNPTYNLPARFESIGARADAAALLHRAGVVIAFSQGDPHNARNIRQLAGNAAAHGLPRDAALAAVTLNPARIYGVADRVGSLQPGRVADVVLWDGDPLEVTSFPALVLIEGREIAPVSRQTLLRDRYLGRLRKSPGR